MISIALGPCPQCDKDDVLVLKLCKGCGKNTHVRCAWCGYVDYMAEIGGLSFEARYAAEMLAGPTYCIGGEFLYGGKVQSEDSTISASFASYHLIEIAKGLTELSDLLHLKRLERLKTEAALKENVMGKKITLVGGVFDGYTHEPQGNPKLTLNVGTGEDRSTYFIEWADGPIQLQYYRHESIQPLTAMEMVLNEYGRHGLEYPEAPIPKVTEEVSPVDESYAISRYLRSKKGQAEILRIVKKAYRESGLRGEEGDDDYDFATNGGGRNT